MSHKVSVDPVDDACSDVSHLEWRWNLWVPGSAIDPDHVRHPLGAIGVSEDHGHSRLDVQKDRIRLGRCNGACMVNRHTPLAGTVVLAQD